jgi:hypothetical protein
MKTEKKNKRVVFTMGGKGGVGKTGVPGNHDKQIGKLTEEFSWLSNLAEISIHGQPVVIL